MNIDSTPFLLLKGACKPPFAVLLAGLWQTDANMDIPSAQATQPATSLGLRRSAREQVQAMAVAVLVQHLDHLVDEALHLTPRIKEN